MKGTLSKETNPDWMKGEHMELMEYRKLSRTDYDIIISYILEQEPTARRRGWDQELRSLIPSLIYAYENGLVVCYYTGQNNKARRTAIDKLKQHGLILNHRGYKIGEDGKSHPSIMMTTPLLYDLFNPLIRITKFIDQGKDKKPKKVQVRYEDYGMAQRIFDYNEFMKDQIVTDGSGNRLKTDLHRCYKEIGGKVYRNRFHQSSYQSLPDTERAHIKINGEDVVRFDLKASHAQIIYQKMNEIMPDDPYKAFPENKIMRDICKCALLMIFNTGKRRSAEKAFEKELRDNTIHYLEAGHYMKTNGIKTKDVFDKVEALNPKLKPHFYTSSCRVAMDIEASLLFKTMEILIRDYGIPSVQIFDELVVQASAEKEALDTLNMVWESYLNQKPILTIERLEKKEEKIIPFYDGSQIDWEAFSVSMLGA